MKFKSVMIKWKKVENYKQGWYVCVKGRRRVDKVAENDKNRVYA